MTFADTARLGLFQGVAFEAMRMRPVSVLHFLEANEATELAGIQVPKGTPDAKEFKPERWVDRRQSVCAPHSTRAFTQFGAGPRFCPGRYLATLEMKMVLATLARNFSFEHAEDPNVTKEIFAFTMMPSRLRLRLRSRARKSVDPNWPFVARDFRSQAIQRCQTNQARLW
jgi:cytochrome P450